MQGCTSYHGFGPSEPPEAIAEINARGETEEAGLVLASGYTYSATALHVRPDSTFWYTGDGILRIDKSTPEISRITFTDRRGGARNGLAIGAMVGGAAGLLVGYVYSQSGNNGPGGSDGPQADEVFAGAAAGAIILGASGLIFGWIHGNRDIYYYWDEKEKK
jgi:hypothetical protein